MGNNLLTSFLIELWFLIQHLQKQALARDYLKQNLLWLACRHQMVEIIVPDV